MNVFSDQDAIAYYKEQISNRYSIDTTVLEWRYVERGECLYEQGFPLSFLAFLVKGKVKIHTTSEDGKQLIVAFNKPIELFGDLELVQQVDTLHTIEAVTTVHIATLPLSIARSWRNDMSFKEILLQSISRKFFTKSTTLAFHLLHEADVKLASYLLSISHDEQGHFIHPLIPKSELKLIAQFIGVTVRHQNRCIQLFEQLGMIARIPGFIKITLLVDLTYYLSFSFFGI